MHVLVADGVTAFAIEVGAGRIVAKSPLASEGAFAGAALDPAELLDVDVDELARSRALVAQRPLESEPPESAQSASSQDPRDRRAGQPEAELAGSEAAVAVRLFSRDQGRELERLGNRHPADLSGVTWAYQVAAFQRPAEDGSRVALRGRRSSSRGRAAEASLERSKRSWEADARTRRPVKRRRGRLAAFWLAKRTPPALPRIDAPRG
jgi:hypothetical protein